MAAHFVFLILFLFGLLDCLELHQEIMVRFRTSKTGLSPQARGFPTDNSKAVVLL